MSGGLWTYLPDLLLLYAAFALAVASPGPSNLVIMSTAMDVGRKPALALAFGVTAGSLTWGALAAAGISALIAANPNALYAIRLLGGAYLLFLGWRSAQSALRNAPRTSSVRIETTTGLWPLVGRGYLMHITNPKAVLNWTAIIAVGLPAQASWQIVAAILLGCMMISLTFNCGYALAFSTAPMVAAYRRARRWIEGALAGFFVFAGFKLLTARL